MVIGLIADTHGTLRPDVHRALAGVDLILHAGDVGGDGILDELRIVAPVRAVYGNTDVPGSIRLTDGVEFELCGLTLHMSHGHEIGSPTPEVLLRTYDADIIVFGHTHRQLVFREGSRLVINPGSAGAPRFDLPPSVAILSLNEGACEVEIIDLW